MKSSEALISPRVFHRPVNNQFARTDHPVNQSLLPPGHFQLSERPEYLISSLDKPAEKVLLRNHVEEYSTLHQNILHLLASSPQTLWQVKQKIIN
jgi:hypothetical protein